MTTKEKERRGQMLVDIMLLRKDTQAGRYKTTWGNKTALGIYETAKRIIGKGK